MRKNRRLTPNFTYNFMLVAAAVAITAVAVLTGARIQEGYDINVGYVSDAKITAPHDVENRVATEKNRQEAASAVDPLYKLDTEISQNILTSLNTFFEQAAKARNEKYNFATPYDIDDDSIEFASPSPLVAAGLLTRLSDNQFNLLINIDNDVYNGLKEQILIIGEQIISQGIEEVDARVLLTLQAEFAKLEWEEHLQSLGYEILADYIVPNKIIDEEATQRARDEKAAAVEPVYYLENQTIVDSGSIITEEIYQVMVDLGLVSTTYTENLLSILGVSIILVIIFLIFIIYVNYFYEKLKQNKKEALLLFTLYTLALAVTWSLRELTMHVLPVLIFAMLTAILLDKSLSVMLNICFIIIASIIVEGEADFLLYYLISGTLAIVNSRYVTERNKIIMVGIATSFVNFSLMTGIYLLFESTYTQDIFLNGAFAALNGIFSVIISVGSLPFWEAVFGVVTPIKLLDLANPNSPPLRRLAMEAPGTYHHSLIVANLAETAAYDIGANPNIARVGAYYHDIGKLKYPQYFSENQVGENPHDYLDPQSSVRVIVNHVDFGLEMANEAKLPQLIKDMIAQHHGNTLVKYFYHKAKKDDPEEEIDDKSYRYKHPIPQSREAAILMLADTVEAAIRSMTSKGKAMDEIKESVRELVKDKLDDGQLLESGLTIKDLEIIVDSFMRVFKGMYHKRIPYPKEEAKKETKKEES